MNFYNISEYNEDDNSGKLDRSCDKIRFKVPLSSYHEEAEEFLSSHDDIESPPKKMKDNFDLSDSADNWLKQSFYKATKYDVNSLIELISVRCSSLVSLLRNEYLEKILLADHNDTNAMYPDRYLMIVADCLAGLYTFDTVRDYAKAISLYQKVIDMVKGKNQMMVDIAQRRIRCCEMLDCTELDPPSEKMIESVKEDAKSDNFSRVVLACYYITAPEYEYSDHYQPYYEAGKKLLMHSVEENYRPGFALLEFLCEEKIITEFKKKEVKEMRKKVKPPMSENNWYE